MLRRSLLVVGALLLALFFAPQLPPVRNALLRWGVSLAAQQGYDVSYQRSAGNVLYGLTLTGLSVTGPGVDASVETLKLGYTLPALVTGILPVRAEISGVRGTLEPSALPLPAAGATPNPARDAPRGPGIRPLLSRAVVSDVALSVRGAPFSVPDFTLTSLEVEQDGDVLLFDTALTSGDAVVEASGQVTLAPFSVGATVGRADVALAEPYFDGARGGTLSGTVQANSGGVRADLELRGGEVGLVGIDLRNVSGLVRLRGRTLTTELTGRALGGPIEGSGRVDLGAQRWQADVKGNAQLAEALEWLAQGRLPPAALENVLDPSGTAAVSLTAEGWRDVTVAGSAAGRGELLGEPLTDLDVDFGFESGVGTTATADARLGGAPLSFSFTPAGAGFTLRADGDDLPLYGFTGDVAVNLEQQGGELTGTAGLDLSGSALGRDVQLSADATTGGEEWRVDLSGRDALGARLSGGLELQNSTVDGAVRVRNLELPGLENPVNLTAVAEGPLPEPPVTLRVSGPQGVHPTSGGVRADADFSGRATATLEGGTLRGLRGDFGPLTVSGTPDDLAYTLAPTTLSGRASGEVALHEGQLSRQDGKLETTAKLSTTGLRGGGVTLPDLNADVSLTWADGLTAAVQDSAAGVDLRVQDGALSGTFEDARVRAGDLFAVSGEVSGRLAELTETLSLDLRAQTPGKSPGTTLRAVGDAQRTRVSLRSDEGATLAGRTLGRALALSGNASLTNRSADLSGTLGEVGVEVTAQPDASGRVRAQTGLRTGGDTFEASFDSLQEWRTNGVLPLAELGEALGLPLTGTLRSTLARQGGRFSGEATAQGQVFGLPLEATATTEEGTLELDATTTLLGETLALSGQALPETDAQLRLGDYGTLEVSGSYPALRVSGSGRLPGFTRAGLEVAAQPWRVQGSLRDGRALLRVGESVIRATRGENGWRLGAQVQQSATWRGLPLTLRADVARSPQRPAGRVQGTLNVDGSPLTLQGSLRDLNLTGTLPAATLQSGLLGELALNVNANALTGSYDATARWRRPDGTQALLLRAEGTRGEVTALARVEGLNARFSTASESPAWRLEADRFALSSLPARQLQGLDAQLDGTLSAENGYEGRLRLLSEMGTAQLTGTGKQLELTAEVDQGALNANLSGTILPNLDLSLEAVAADAARLNGTLTGTFTDPQLTADLRTAAQNPGNGQLRVPARQLQLRASLEDGLRASLTGEGIAVRLREGRWEGELGLPFRLRGTPHRLAGTFAGTLAEPVLAATLEGPTLRGPLTLSRDGLTGELTVTPDLEAVPDAQVEVGLSATPDLRWQLDLSGTATLPYRALRAAVEGRITGEGVRYTGEGVAEVAGERVPLSLSGAAGHASARAELREVALAPFLPAQGSVSGDVRLETNGKVRYFADLNATGEALGRPFDLTLSADRAGGLTLSGSAAGAGVSLTGAAPFTTLNLKVADTQQPLDASVSLGVGEMLSVQGSGGWRGEAFSVNGAYTPNLGSGEARLELGDAALNATLRRNEAGGALTATVTAPTGVLSFETPVQAEVRLTQTEDALNISQLDAQAGDAALTLEGTVRPQTDVSGVLTVPAADDPIALRLTTLETGYLAALTQGTLELRGVLSPGFVPERVRLEGTLSRSSLELESDLVWQEGAGFSGRADLTLTPTKTAAATLTLSGEEGPGETGLRVRGGARYRGTRVATLSAQLSAEPWRDRQLDGTLRLDAPIHTLSPVWPGEPLRLAGELNLLGNLTAPQLAGPLTLRGALTASGRLRADRQGAALTLSGDGLRASAALGAEGYRSTLSLDELDLSELAPQLAEPATLSGAVRGAQTWGDAPLVQLSELRLSSGESRVQGRARFAETLSGALELDVHLGDFSPNLRGRLTGPVRVGPREPLAGALTLTGLGPTAADWALGGDVTLSGSVAQPLVGVALRGTGSASGTVRAEGAPRRGYLSLESDLSVAGAETNFVLTRTRVGVSAAGTLAYRDFEVSLRTQQGLVLLTGDDRLAGWRGRYGPTRLSLRGPLTSLNPQLSGTLALTGTPDLRAVSGALSNTAFGPVTLGDVALEAQAGRLSLRGEALAAEVGLSGGLPWQLSRLTLALPGGAALTASGAGTRERGGVSGALSAASLELPLRARYTSDALTLSGGGTLPVGALSLRARLEDGTWQGHLNVANEGERVIESTLSGPLAAPTLSGRLDLARDENTVRGTFALEPAAARLEVQLSSPQLSAPLTLSGSGWPLELTLATPEDALRLALRDGQLRPSGALSLSAGPADLMLQENGGRLRLSLAAPAAPGLALRTTLPDTLSGFANLLGGVEGGVTFRGVKRTSGTLSAQLRPTPRFTAEALRWRSPAGTLALSGTGTAGEGSLAGISGALQGRWRGAEGVALPWLRSADVPFTLRAEAGSFSALSVSELGRAEAQFDADSSHLSLESALTLGQGLVTADVSYAPETGPSGTIDLESVPVFTFAKRVATLGGRLLLSPGGVSGSGDLSLAGGQAALAGEAGWARLLPPSWQRLTPEGGDALTAQVRLSRFALGGIPQVAARLPYLRAPVSGLATVTGTQIVGQLVAPELQVLETPLPTQLEFNGTLRALEVRGTFADSRLNLRYSRDAAGARLGGLVTLEQFPLQVLAEAVVGASQVDAPTTGAVRFDVPLRNPQAGYVRLATERLTLTSTGPGRGGETTRGEVALRFENGSLFVERAEFRGDGFWQASGILTPAELDFALEAENADFTPLLRLAPRLAAFGVGAQGSVALQATGSATAPDITLSSPRLDLSVAGSSYRALDTQASLSGGAFGLSSEIVGVSPIVGRLELLGSGQVNLAPFVTSDLALRFSGAATVPSVGSVTDIEGRIYPAEAGWQLYSSGVLGRPFTVSGDLAPLDLTVTGSGLNVQARQLFVASSSTDVDLAVRADDGGFGVSGAALVREAQLSLDRGRGRTSDPAVAETADEATEEEEMATDTAAETAAEATEEEAVATIGSVVRRTTNPALVRLRFDDVRLQAPQEVVLQEAFGNAELSLDLTLSGTAATPRLDGQAQTLRGSIRFSGQDFTLTRGVATFDPAQGAYPTLDIGATASFDKTRALGNLAEQYSLVEPSGTTFETLLNIIGSFEEGPGGRRILNLEPTLSSNALIQEEGVGIPRPLEEAELVALLTLGRLQLDAPITGTNSLAGTVAESALDTAVDLLLVSELQDALGEALGVDLLEIRTSALSTFLGADGQDQDFGVSVRLGGYLSENLFASVQVGRYDDPEQAYALSNEFSLRYTAASLELNLSGGVNFPDQNTLSAVTDFALGLSYAVTPLISLDASLETTTRGRDTSVGFGVSFTF